MQQKDVYDQFINACYNTSPKRELRRTLKNFKENGITQKPVNQCIKKATNEGIIIPLLKQKDNKLIINHDEKYNNYGSFSTLQDIANQFSLFIYGKEFNNGNNGILGEAQQIVPKSKNYNIILNIHNDFNVLFELDYDRMTRDKVKILIYKLKKSIIHYKKCGFTINHFCNVTINYV